MNFTLVGALFKLHFVTPVGFVKLMYSFVKEGLTLMSILRFSSYYYANEVAFVSEGKQITYGKLYAMAVCLTRVLRSEHCISKGMRVGVLCRNHTVSALLLVALSRLGIHIRLLNTDIMSEKMDALLRQRKMDYIFYDEELREKCLPTQLPCKGVTTETLQKQMDTLKTDLIRLPRVVRGGQIAVLTGGSSGNYNEASRKTGLFQFLPPFFALLKDIKIQNYASVFVALPFYHGFGLGVLIIALAMGKKICMSRHFHTDEALETIAREQVEVLPIVPTMLSRMWQSDNASKRMKTVKCIISGGDRLEKKLVDETHRHLGPVMYNLYGTSEAGFFMLATPADLDANAESTLGKPIHGVECDVRELRENGVGTLWVRSKWAMIGQQNRWQSTGDLVYRNERGYFFHCGIDKNMVVCGGENVFPESVEQIINRHPYVVASKVYGVPHEDFGSVLNAVVELRDGVSLTEEELKGWVRTKLSRAEMPHHIEFRKIDVLSTGKRMKIS